MRSPETFDAYYVETRTRLLHEAYALTGDAPAARAAVRDAFVVAWHHWRKVALLDDRDAYVRPIALRRARRRHTARIWHRDKSLDAEARSTLDALSKLTARQRELLVLNGLSALSLADLSREVGLPRGDAERELQTATAQFALHRDVPTTEVSRLLHDLAAPLEEIRWPRATAVRRSGSARRRTHTVIGAGLATAALVVSGSLVATGSGAEATSLDEEKATAGVTVHAPVDDSAGEEIIGESALLSAAQMSRFGAGLDWEETATTDNLSGDGLLAPCQRERFSDPDGVTAMARTWEGSTTRVVRRTVGQGEDRRTRKRRVSEVESTAVQMVEMSRGPRQAARGFDTASLWFAGCADPRTQLLSTRTVKRVGDEARTFRLRSWGKQPATITVGAARTGSLVLTHVVRSQGRAASRQGRPHRARRRRQRRVRVGGGRHVRRPCPGPRHGTARRRYAARGALGGRPPARRGRPWPLGRHRPREGAQQLRLHALRPHHLHRQGDQPCPDPDLPLPRDAERRPARPDADRREDGAGPRALLRRAGPDPDP